MPEPSTIGFILRINSSTRPSERRLAARVAPPASQMSFPGSPFYPPTSPAASSETSVTSSSGLPSIVVEKTYCLERLTKPLHVAPADQGGPEVEDRLVDVVPPLVAYLQAPVAVQPRQRALHDPTARQRRERGVSSNP
jgi:hypothetical protein